jgi:hypothetical protein
MARLKVDTTELKQKQRRKINTIKPQALLNLWIKQTNIYDLEIKFNKSFLNVLRNKLANMISPI